MFSSNLSLIKPTHRPRLEVDIPTATVIVVNEQNPNLILVGKSKKHIAPVLPGGKIDSVDLVSVGIEMTARRCVSRELKEEIGISVADVDLNFFEINADLHRDNRLVRADSLRGTLVESIIKDLQPDEMVLGRYGVPDYVFVVNVNPKDVKPSEELIELSWIDADKIDEHQLSAGHSDILKRYLKLRS